MSWIDKTLAAVSPGLAYRRAIGRHNLRVFNDMSSAYHTRTGGYHGGQYGRRRAMVSSSTAQEDGASGYTYRRMISTAMDLYRNDPLTRSIVDVCSTYLGASRPTPTTSDADWNKAAVDYWHYWQAQADARNRPGVDYDELQVLWDRFCWYGGDMLFGLMDGQLLPYEGVQIQTPGKLVADRNIVNGVRVRAKPPWRITHYYIVEPGTVLVSGQDFKRIRDKDCIFAPSRHWRPAMLRGVPDLHGVIDALHGFGETLDNVQGKVRLESMIWTVERKGSIGRVPGSRALDRSTSDGTQVDLTKADHGMRVKVNGDPSADFQFAQMANPHSEYVTYMKFMAQVIAAGTGIPYEIALHEYTRGSYTAHRAARLDFARFILNRWAWRNRVLNARVWNWRIAKAIKAGDLPPAPIDDRGISEWHKVAWTLPHFPHIDEGKEVVADIKQWGCAQESFADWGAQRGVSRDQLLDAHDLDVTECKRRAEALQVPLEQYMGQLFMKAAAEPERKPGDVA